jgi:hypothetical protein
LDVIALANNFDLKTARLILFWIAICRVKNCNWAEFSNNTSGMTDAQIVGIMKMLIIIAIAGMAVAGCGTTTDDNAYPHAMSGTKAVNPLPGTYAIQSMERNAPANQLDQTNNPTE